MFKWASGGGEKASATILAIAETPGSEAFQRKEMWLWWMMEATALCAVLIIPSQVKKSNKCLWLAGCAGAVLVPDSVKHSPFSPWGISEESWLMCWWLRGLFLMQEPQMQDLCHSTHPTPWPGEGWWKAACLCWPGADFLLHSEVWCLPKGSWDNPPLGFPGVPCWASEGLVKVLGGSCCCSGGGKWGVCWAVSHLGLPG